MEGEAARKKRRSSEGGRIQGQSRIPTTKSLISKVAYKPPFSSSSRSSALLVQSRDSYYYVIVGSSFIFIDYVFTPFVVFVFIYAGGSFGDFEFDEEFFFIMSVGRSPSVG